MPLTSYAALQKAFTTNIGGVENRARIGEIYRASIEFLARAKREPLNSLIPNKRYFAFRYGKKLSRAVNAISSSLRLANGQSSIPPLHAGPSQNLARSASRSSSTQSPSAFAATSILQRSAIRKRRAHFSNISSVTCSHGASASIQPPEFRC
jgi:hypothetical protein